MSAEVTPRVKAALDAAAIPQFKVGPARHARLGSGERALYFWILRRFNEHGRPSRAETRRTADELGLELEGALDALARDDLVHTDRDGEIVVAYPFSGRATDHVVRFENGVEVYAMCAIDALGIAPMFGQAIGIDSRDGLTSESVVVALMPDGTGRWEPDGAVVVCGSSGGGESCSSCCPVLNFFASDENGEEWLAQRPGVRGYVMTMREAVEAGRAVFGDVLTERY